MYTEDAVSNRYGTDLPATPAELYQSVEGAPKGNDSNWYVAVVPAREKQAVNPVKYGDTATVTCAALLPPQQPKITVTPSITNKTTVALSWSGAVDIDSAGKPVTNLGKGRMEYRMYQNPAYKGDTWLSTGSSKSSGDYALNIQALAEGLWYVEMRAKDDDGNLSVISDSVGFTKDISGPTTPNVSVIMTDPVSGWTKADSIRLNWGGLTDKYSAMKEIKYCVYNGENDKKWLTLANTKEAGYIVFSLAGLPTGQYTVEIKASDELGNIGNAGQATFLVDHDKPTFAPVIAPDVWSELNGRTYSWSLLNDIGSGLSSFTYALPSGIVQNLPINSASGQKDIDVSGLLDGTHALTLVAKDKVGNSTTQTLSIQLDRVAPVVSLQGVNSSVRDFAGIYGLVQDTSIKTWVLRATGSSGTTIELSSGTTNQANGTLLGMLNAAEFSHGETVQLTLEATDAVGLTAQSDTISTTIDRRTLTIDGSNVQITSPTSGQQLTTAQHQGSYALHGTGSESQSYLFVDDAYTASAKSSAFTIDPVRYAEGSSHRLYLITQNTSGKVSYSDGLKREPLGGHTFRTNSGVQFSGGAAASGVGAYAKTAAGSVSASFNSSKTMLAFTFRASASGAVSYEYSTDGSTWKSCTSGNDVVLTKPASHVQIRANLGIGATLHGWAVEAVQEDERYPHSFSVRLLRAVEEFQITQDRDITHAFTDISTSGLEQATAYTPYLYADDVKHNESFTYHALTAQERTEHDLALFALTDAQRLYGVSPAKASILYRNTVHKSGTVLSGAISASGVFALRLEAASHNGNGSYYYSLDGTAWTAMENTRYTMLPRKATQVYLKAVMPAGSTLVAWHLEGVTGGSQTFDVQTVNAPTNVYVADYGNYYEDPARRKYIIAWLDAGPQDDTLGYTTKYEVYRDDDTQNPLAVVSGVTRYTDMDYYEGASYHVQTVRTYTDPQDAKTNELERRSVQIAAQGVKPPTKPTLHLYPVTWFHAPEALLDISGVSNFVPITDLEYRILADGVSGEEADLVSYISTEIADTELFGYPVPVDGLVDDGPYVLQARSVHEDGNHDLFGSASVLIDRTPPVLSDMLVAPETWTNEDTLTLSWTGVMDEFSGVEKIEYAVNGGKWVDVGSVDEDGDIAIDISALWDGIHRIVLRLSDVVGNQAEFEKPFYVDRTNPELTIHSPIDGASIAGILEIHASVWDRSLQSWTLTAVGEAGNRQPIANGDSNQYAQIVGMWNTAGYEQNERVQMLLEAVDIAGNTHAVSNLYIKVDRSMQSVSGQVKIVSPIADERLSLVQNQGTYEVPASQTAAYVYVDGLAYQQADVNKSTFAIDTVRFAENTSHTLSMIVRGQDGRAYYSDGLGSQVIMSDVFADQSTLASWNGIDFTPSGAGVTDQASGTLVTQRIESATPLFALRLKTTESVGSGSIAYSYSVDGGNTFTSFSPRYDAIFAQACSAVQIRAELVGDAVLRGWELQGVYEMRPQRFAIEMLRAVETFAITQDTRVKYAKGTLPTNLSSSITDRWLLHDGDIHSASFQYDLTAAAAELTQHRIQAIGISADQVLHAGISGKANIVLRESRDDSGTVTVGPLKLNEKIQAVRLEALSSGKQGRYYISGNGTDWTEMTLTQYKVISSTDTLYVRAVMPSGSRLLGWHVEGVAVGEKAVRAEILKAPSYLAVEDYGDYFMDTSLRRYDLEWTDPNAVDDTLDYKQYYLVYRNGELLAKITEPFYTDEEYLENALYSVRIVREYQANGQYAKRQSPVTLGQVQEMIPAPVYPKVSYVQQEYTQSQFIDDVYGGKYTFNPNAEPPSTKMILDQERLGAAVYCAAGFEPINFNTGNFFLQTQDVSLENNSLAVTRMYNTLSNEEDGAFGSKWGSELNMHLTLYGNGSISLRDSEGAMNVFYIQEDGSYVSDNEDLRTLTINDEKTEYTVHETDGTSYIFATAGLMKEIRKNGVTTMRIERDERGFMTGLVSQSGLRTPVEMDQYGHITKLTLADGSEITYGYDENNLVSVTDASGGKTRYLYDTEGRMTQWYDANGNRQVYNEYDEQSRVVYQKDALNGEYSLEYHGDYTTTTDAQGYVKSYYFDEQMNTTKVVDILGGVTTYTYGEDGQIATMTDAMGGVNRYAYNANGDKIKDTDPRGAVVEMTYDEDHHLLTLKDQKGNITTYTYDESGNRLTETAPDGGVTRYTYDEKGNMLSKTDAMGGKTTYEYENDLPIRMLDPLGNETTYTYDANGNLATLTDALGSTNTYEHDAKGNLLRLTFADGTYVTYTYDAMNNQTSMTDMLGNVTKYSYDALGNLLTLTKPDGSKQRATYNKSDLLETSQDELGGKTTYTYDANGNKLTATDPMGAVTSYEYDLDNRLIRETSPTGGETTYTYDAVGLPLSVTDATGAAQTMTYDGAGNMRTRTLPNGAVIAVTYDEMNRPIKQVNALGGITTIAYDLLGNITEVTDPLGAKTSYTYDAAGNLLTVMDGAGGKVTYTYDALGRTTTSTDAQGAVTAYEYDAVGNLTATVDALGNKTSYTYDENAQLVGMTDALGQTVALEYNANGNATAAVQKNGGVLATAYDKAGRVASETDANGSTTKYAYDKNGLMTQVTDALNQKVTFDYDTLGNVTKITAPGKAVTLYEYDAAGRAMTMTDAEGLVTAFGYNDVSQIESLTVNGNATAYEYDLAGNITSVTDAENRRVEFTYDKAGNLLEIIYPDGTKDNTEYDALGRVVKTTPRTGLATAYEYDALGNVTSITQGEQVTSYTYDLLGRLTKVTAPDGTQTQYEYDVLGNLIGSTDPLGSSTAFSYTAESLLEMVTYANGTTQSLGYDIAGNVISEMDGEGNTKQYKYDKVNRLSVVTDEAGNKTSYTYDTLDNIAKVTDALKHVTSYTYDKNGNLTSETDALGNKVEYTYTPEGRLESILKADGNVLTFAYDKTGNMVLQNIGEDQSITGDYNKIGMVTKVSSPEGEIVYQYNEQGYLISVENINGDMVSYTYDAYGNKTSMTYPDGHMVSYEYDSMNRMTSVIGLDGEKTAYTYDAAGRRVETKTQSTTDTADLTTTYQYDSVGNLLKQATSGLTDISFAYSYNKNGYITGEKRIEDGKTTSSAYTYDVLGELTSFTQSTGYGESYSYDVVGNMLQKVITPEHGGSEETTAVTLSMKYNKGNQLTTMTSGKDKISYSYDANGNMTNKSLTAKQYGRLTDTYAYNVLDQLTSYTGYDGYTQQLSYDANGMRTTKKEVGNKNRSTLEELLRGEIAGLPDIVEPTVLLNSDEATDIPTDLQWATTEYLYDITQEYYQVIEETTSSKNSSTTTAYAYGLERIAAYTDSQTTNYVYDGRGSVVQAIFAPVPGENISSALPDVAVNVQSITYTAFGEQMGVAKVSGFTYNAESFDIATSMLNLRARQYEPAQNRFSQKDIFMGQIQIPLSQNRYTYVRNSPICLVDPSGELLSSILKGLKSIGDAIGSLLRISTVKAEPVTTKQTMKKKVIAKLQEANGANSKATSCMDAQDSRNAMDNLKYFNAKTKLDVRKEVNNARRADGLKPLSGNLNREKEMVPKKEDMYASEARCVDYVTGILAAGGVDMDRFAEDGNAGRRLSTSTYAALVGGESRSKVDYGSEMHPIVKGNIRIGNESLPMQINGVDAYDADEYSYSQKEQLEMLFESNVVEPLDVVMTTAASDDGPGHGQIMDSATTFSALNTDQYGQSFDFLFKGYESKNNVRQEDAYEQMNFILINKEFDGLIDVAGETWP